MKRKLLILGLMLGSLLEGVVGSAPVVAAGYRPAVIYVGRRNTTESFYWTRGVKANVVVDDLDMACGGGVVESIYETKTVGDNQNFVEFGWSQDRNDLCIHEEKHLFITASVAGQQYGLWTLPGISNGTYSLYIYQDLLFPGVWVFKYIAPNGITYIPQEPGGGGAVAFDSVTNGGWSQGKATVSEEHIVVTDEAGCCHDNVRVFRINESGGWVPANVTYNSHIVKVSTNFCSSYDQYVPRSGNDGDEVLYNELDC